MRVRRLSSESISRFTSRFERIVMASPAPLPDQHIRKVQLKLPGGMDVTTVDEWQIEPGPLNQQNMIPVP